MVVECSFQPDENNDKNHIKFLRILANNTRAEWNNWSVEKTNKQTNKKNNPLPTWNSVLCKIIKNGETPKLPKDIIRKLQTNMCHQHRCKTPSENTSSSNSIMWKENIHNQVDYSRNTRLFQYLKISSCNPTHKEV